MITDLMKAKDLNEVRTAAKELYEKLIGTDDGNDK